MRVNYQKNWIEELYVYAIEVLQNGGFDIGNATISKNDIIMEAEIANLTKEVDFFVNESHQEDFITEINLNANDIFVVGKWGLFLLNTIGKEDVAFIEHTFPDDKVFYSQEARRSEAFYNARLYFMVNNMIILNGIPTNQFRIPMSRAERLERNVDEMRMIDQKIILIGSTNGRFRLVLPRDVQFGATHTRIRLRLSGLLVQNALRMP